MGGQVLESNLIAFASVNHKTQNNAWNVGGQLVASQATHWSTPERS